MDMKLAHFTLQTQIKVKEELFYCCSTFDSYNRVFNKEHDGYLDNVMLHVDDLNVCSLKSCQIV
jgi:hypothetical protein